MADKISVITGTKIIDTGRVSFKFMFDSDAPRDHTLPFKAWGTLCKRDKDDNYLDPFRFARGEEGAIGDDGIPRWRICLFENGHGSVYGAGWDADGSEGDLKNLKETFQGMPNCCILMSPEIFEEVKEYFEGIELLEHHFEGELVTC